MTKQVQHKGEPLFSCDNDGLFQFLEDVKRRAKDYQWSDPRGIISIPQGKGLPDRNIVKVYGAITHEEISAHDATYVGTQDRCAQDNAHSTHA